MKMRRSDRALDEEATQQILETSLYGVLATVNSEGMPYGLPISYAYEDGVIYMHCTNAGGQNLENIANSKKASFTMVNLVETMPSSFSTKYRSAIAFGEVEVVVSEEEKRKGMRAILQKYSVEYMEQGLEYLDRAIDKIHVLRFMVDSITGKGRL